MSSLPQLEDWTLMHTTRVMHRLMYEVLGYKTYAVQGGDWVRFKLHDQLALLNISTNREVASRES